MNQGRGADNKERKMSKIKDGGPAFPNVPDGAGDKWQLWGTGMSMRDYFAAKAMQALIGRISDTPENVARGAYMMADAMLAERGE
jgi:hypothetical protein